MTRAICVYGFDLDSSGRLGRGTIRRLKKGYQRYCQTGGTLYLAATWSPYHDTRVHMATIMRDWLVSYGNVPSDQIVVIEGNSFDTDGEARVFSAIDADVKEVISSCWHLLRVWRLHRRYEKQAELILVPVWDLPSPKMFFLEVVKNIAMFFPTNLQRRCKKLAMKVFGKTSW